MVMGKVMKKIILFWSAMLFFSMLLTGSKGLASQGQDTLKNIYFRVKVVDEASLLEECRAAAQDLLRRAGV